MPYIGNQHNVGDHVNNFKVLDDISSYTATFNGSATSVVSTSNDTIRIPVHRFIQGQRVTYNNGGGSNIGGLTSGTAYYVSFDSSNTIKLATSLSNANSNTVINLSSVGGGTSHTLNAAFDGINTKFKVTYASGKAARFNNATQLNVAINNVIQRPNLSAASFTEGFAIEDSHKIVFKDAPTASDIFWGSIIANTIENFDLRDNEIDNFTGNGSTTEFTLSTVPANNESVIVTIDGVLQHPSDSATTRAYTLIDSIIQFSSAPALNAEIQVRHIGFAGATTNDVSGFYGRTGNVALTANDHITTGDLTSRNVNISGILTASSASFGGNVSIGGTLSYEDVTNIDSVGIITARDGIFLPNNKHISLGTGNDMRIYSAAGGLNNSFLKKTGTGPLNFDFQGDFLVRNTAGSMRAKFTGPLGAVELYHTSQKKFETTSSGVSITQDLDVDGHTNLDNVSIVGVTTITGTLLDLNSSSANPAIFKLRTNVNTCEIEGRVSGGENHLVLSSNNSTDHLKITGSAVQLPNDNQRLEIGANQELKIAQDGTHNITYMQNVGPLQLQTDDLRLYNYSTQDLYLRAQTNAGVSLWYDYSNHSTAKLTTTATGVTIDGTAVAGGLDISGDIDVDGHTNLDNVNIAGVTTTTGDITIDGLHSGGSSRMLNIGSGNNILRIYENSSQAAQIYTQGNLVLTGATTEIRSKSGSNQLEASFHATNGVKLYHDNNEKLFVNGSGVNITGVTTITGSGSSVLFLESSNPMIRLTDTDNSAYSAIGGEGGNLYLYTNSTARDFIFRGTGEVARLTGDGKLGIGTHTPTTSLHTYSEGNAHVVLHESAGGHDSRLRIKAPPNRYSQLEFADDDADAGEIRYFHTDNYMSFHVNNNVERLRITSSGQVGINSTSPAATLEIKDVGSTGPCILIRGATSTEGDVTLPDGETFNFGHWNYSTSTFTERLRISSNGDVRVGSGAPATFGSGTTVHETYNANTYTANLVTSGTHQLQMIASQTHGATSIGTRSNHQLNLCVNDSTKASITTSGRVLVNKTSTSLTHKLQVESADDANAIAIIGRSADDIGEFSFYENDGSTKLGEIQYRQDHVNFRHRVGDIRFATAGATEKVRIDTAGRLLVNTTGASISSSELFEVKSTSSGFSHFRNNHSGYAPIYIDNEYTNTAMAPLITITDGGGNRAGLLLDPNSVFDITGQGAVTFSTGGTVGNATERVRISSSGAFHINSVAGGQAVIAYGNPTGNSFQEQNRIGGDTIFVADESISSAISMPRQGCFVIITAFSDSSGNYPQPNTSCMAYIDCGPSRNIRICDLGTLVGTAVASKNAYTSNVSDCDNNKLTIMAGNTQGTFRLVNRESNNDYYYQITFL